jgi:hypothetical protein
MKRRRGRLGLKGEGAAVAAGWARRHCACVAQRRRP